MSNPEYHIFEQQEEFEELFRVGNTELGIGVMIDTEEAAGRVADMQQGLNTVHIKGMRVHSHALLDNPILRDMWLRESGEEE